MTRIAGVMRMHLKDRWSWFFIPWLILLCSFTINLIIAGIIDKPVYTGGIASIYVFMLISGIISLPQTFAFAIGFSVRRKDYFLGTIATVAAVSLGSAILLFIFSLIESGTGGWGVVLHFFHMPYLNDGSAFEQLWIYFGAMLHMFVSGFVISSIHRKYGRVGMYVFFAVLLLISTILGFLLTYYEWWDNIGRWVLEQAPSASALTSALSLLTLVYIVLSYLLLRRATV